MSFLAMGGGIALAAGAASAYLNNRAQNSAIKAQQNALNGIQGVNIPALNSLVTQTDLQKYQEDFTAQAQVDPQFAALRTQGATAVLGALADNANPNSITNTGIKTLAGSTLSNVAPTQSVISGLLTQAQQELAAGATLPPAFQAEVIRSGLAQGGAAGTGVAGEGSTGVGVRTLLGSAGINLEAQRQQQAEAAGGSAASLEQQQAAALGELTQLSSNLTAAKANLGSGAVGIANASMPSIGLSGNQVADISVGNTNQKNQTTIASGNLGAQSALNNGSMWSSLLGTLGSGASMAGSWLNGLGAGSGSNAATLNPSGSGSLLGGSSSFGGSTPLGSGLSTTFVGGNLL